MASMDTYSLHTWFFPAGPVFSPSNRSGKAIVIAIEPLKFIRCTRDTAWRFDLAELAQTTKSNLQTRNDTKWNDRLVSLPTVSLPIDWCFFLVVRENEEKKRKKSSCILAVVNIGIPSFSRNYCSIYLFIMALSN